MRVRLNIRLKGSCLIEFSTAFEESQSVNERCGTDEVVGGYWRRDRGRCSAMARVTLLSFFTGVTFTGVGVEATVVIVKLLVVPTITSLT